MLTEQAASQTAGFGATGNLRSTGEYYPYARGKAFDGRIKSMQSADGRLTTFTYEYGLYDGAGFTPGEGKALKTTITQGTVGGSRVTS